MAYAAVITENTQISVNPDMRRIVITETEAAAASEWGPTSAIPKDGTIVSRTVTIEAGTGVTVAPSLGRAATYTADTDDEIEAHAAAARISNQSPVRYTDANVLYGRSAVNAGTDNTVVTTLLIRGDWR